MTEGLSVSTFLWAVSTRRRGERVRVEAGRLTKTTAAGTELLPDFTFGVWHNGAGVVHEVFRTA